MGTDWFFSFFGSVQFQESILPECCNVAVFLHLCISLSDL